MHGPVFEVYVGLPASKVKALALEIPGVFGLDVDDQMRPRIDALREMGMPIKSIPKFLGVVPDLLEADGWERRQGAMTFLTSWVSPRNDWARVLRGIRAFST